MTNVNSTQTDKKRTNIPVFRFDVAKQLLKLGYTIADIAPNLMTGRKFETVFYFKNENQILSKIKEITMSKKESNIENITNNK